MSLCFINFHFIEIAPWPKCAMRKYRDWYSKFLNMLHKIQYQRSLIHTLCVLQTYFKISIGPILTQNKIHPNSKRKKSHLYAMQLFSFLYYNILKKIEIFFRPWKHKKLASKVAHLWQFGFFSLAAPSAQNSPESNTRFIDSSIQWSVVLYLGLNSIA